MGHVEQLIAGEHPVGSLDKGRQKIEFHRRQLDDSAVPVSQFVTVEIEDELATDGQRGLLGLAVRRSGDATDIYASWTRADDGRLVVGRLASGRINLVWEGPVSADRANGGTLAFRGDELLVSIGDLEDPASVDDPEAPNGKIFALDPEAGVDQQATVGSSGWNNPFAMTVLAAAASVASASRSFRRFRVESGYVADLALVGLLLAVGSFVGVLAIGVPALVLDPC